MKIIRWLDKHPFVKYRLPVYALVLLIFLTSVMPGSLIKVGLKDPSMLNFNYLHLTAYFVLGYYMSIALINSKKISLKKHNYYFTILFCFLFGFFNEIIQHFVPDRYFGILDIYYNLIGILLSQLFVLALYKK